jgi:hypothetical protein
VLLTLLDGKEVYRDPTYEPNNDVATEEK